MTSMSSRAGASRQQRAAFFSRVESAFGTLRVMWREASTGPEVFYISLPNEPWPVARGSRGPTPEIALASCPEIDRLGEDLHRYLGGEPVHFNLGLTALATCSGFQREVLLAQYAIPRGAVSTYGRVARALGHPGAARAVGQALARNPFPLIIPCHRAVRSDSRLGGYRGGLSMKRALLRFEGVDTDPRGRVLVDRFYY